MLFTPERHEPLGDAAYSALAARTAIERIVERAEADMVDGLWPLDDEERTSEDEKPGNGLHYGAAGIFWALGELGRPVAHELVERLGADDPDGADSVWGGIPGVLAVAEHFWPDARRRERVAEYAQASL